MESPATQTVGTFALAALCVMLWGSAEMVRGRAKKQETDNGSFIVDRTRGMGRDKRDEDAEKIDLIDLS